MKSLDSWYKLRELGGAPEWLAWLNGEIAELELLLHREDKPVCRIETISTKRKVISSPEPFRKKQYGLICGWDYDFTVCEGLRRGMNMYDACFKAGISIGFYKQWYTENEELPRRCWQSNPPYIKLGYQSQRPSDWPERYQSEKQNAWIINDGKSRYEVPHKQYWSQLPKDIFKKSYFLWDFKPKLNGRFMYSASLRLLISRVARFLYFIDGNQITLNNGAAIYGTSDRCEDLESELIQHIWRYAKEVLRQGGDYMRTYYYSHIKRYAWPKILSEAIKRNKRLQTDLELTDYTLAVIHSKEHGYMTPRKHGSDGAYTDINGSAAFK